jgi:DNA-binding NarL/FixJ family response regulator
MRHWDERSRIELRAAGVRTEARPPRAIDELTPQQRQIAQFAARGLTNREIGDRMFLSPKTIAFHLYSVFPKLQITTRSQLAAAIGEHDEAADQ